MAVGWLRIYGPWLLLLAALWGWRETWVEKRCAAQVAQVRWEEQEARLSRATDQVDVLLTKLEIPKWWKNQRPR